MAFKHIHHRSEKMKTLNQMYARGFLGTLLNLAVLVSPATAASTDGLEKPYKFAVITQTGSDNLFWKSIKRGMDDACSTLKVDCELVFTKENGNLKMHLQNFETAVRQKVDGIALVIVDDKLYREPVAAAIAAGVPVIALNVDDTKGEAGSKRLAFVGQDLFQAGYELAKGLYAQMDHKKPQHVLLGLARPGESWAESRIGGARKFFNEVNAAHPKEEITYKVIESWNDYATTGKRICEYVKANPKTTAYIDSGFWMVGAGPCLREMGIKPNQILMGGFDLVPDVLEEMKKGYIHLTIDQQPYLQGYLPILQLYFMKKFGLSAWDVNTGKAMIRPSDVPAVTGYVAKGVR
jgi:simple sugar transport system substrate-binding protein